MICDNNYSRTKETYTVICIVIFALVKTNRFQRIFVVAVVSQWTHERRLQISYLKKNNNIQKYKNINVFKIFYGTILK